jgi:hypothetical protein
MTEPDDLIAQLRANDDVYLYLYAADAIEARDAQIKAADRMADAIAFWLQFRDQADSELRASAAAYTALRLKVNKLGGKE